MKQFACRDAGYYDCDYKVSGTDEKDVLNRLKEHASEKHGIKDFSLDMISTVKSKIHDIKEDINEQKAKSA